MSKKIGIFAETLDKLIGDKFGNYSKYIIQERALPDLRDGLKPVQRRILFAMRQLKLTHESGYKKSARVVGDVIGKYHPHGDTSVYDAMVRLGQEWKVNQPLIEMHGNYGSIDNDPVAAMRYTETRLGAISEFLLKDIEKGIVSFAPNFDDTEVEPTVLPAQFPNLLVNGASGIASGYSTTIPPHNLNEVIKALIYVHKKEKNEGVVLSDLTRIIKGPDYPTGGIASSSKTIKEIYRTGKGKVTIRAKMEYDEKKSEIYITELPFEVVKGDLVRKIDDQIRAGNIPTLKEVRDDSDRKGMQITIKTQKGIDWKIVESWLYKKTDLQKNQNANMVVIKDKRPELLGLVEMLSEFALFQRKLYRKSFEYDLEKVTSRLEIVEGLIKVTDIIDEIIKIIRASSGKADAKNKIIERFDFTERQAEAIVSLRLYRLSSTDVNALKDEKSQLTNDIEHYNKALKNREYLVEIITNDLYEFNKKFKTPRRTIIEDEYEAVEISEKDLISEEKVVIVVTHHGYIKRVSQKSRDSSTKGTLGLRNDDLPISIIDTSNLNSLLLFTSEGRYYSIPIIKLKEYKWKDIGDHFSKYTSASGNETIIKVISISEEEKLRGSFISSTSNGLVKRFKASEINSITTKRGQKYAGIKGSDKVVSVAHAFTDDFTVFSITSLGKTLRYSSLEIPFVGLSASGVKNMKLEIGDKVVSTIVGDSDEIRKGLTQAIVFTDNGKVKRFRIKEAKDAKRGSIGKTFTKMIKGNPHKVINMFDVSKVDSLSLLTTNDERKKILPKTDIKLTTFDEGLSLIDKAGIKIIVGNKVQDSSLQSLRPSEMSKEQTLELKLNIKNILKKI